MLNIRPALAARSAADRDFQTLRELFETSGFYAIDELYETARDLLNRSLQLSGYAETLDRLEMFFAQPHTALKTPHGFNNTYQAILEGKRHAYQQIKTEIVRALLIGDRCSWNLDTKQAVSWVAEKLEGGEAAMSALPRLTRNLQEITILRRGGLTIEDAACLLSPAWLTPLAGELALIVEHNKTRAPA